MPGPDHDAVLFDLDGVLVDSRAAITGCINHALVEHELSAQPVEALHRFIGPSLAVAFAELTGDPPDSALVASCLGSYRAHYAEASLQETVVTPGIENSLPSIGVTWGIGSTEELQEAGAGSIVNVPAELPASVRQLLEPTR